MADVFGARTKKQISGLDGYGGVIVGTATPQTQKAQDDAQKRIAAAAAAASAVPMHGSAGPVPGATPAAPYQVPTLSGDNQVFQDLMSNVATAKKSRLFGYSSTLQGQGVLGTGGSIRRPTLGGL